MLLLSASLLLRGYVFDKKYITRPFDWIKIIHVNGPVVPEDFSITALLLESNVALLIVYSNVP